ncbi:MAG: methyltransferase domain-containing protein [Candidatus Xenobia bacterium]
MADSYLSLLAAGLQNQVYRLGLEAKEVARLGGHGWWWRLRLALGRHYVFDSPYRIVVQEGAATGLDESCLIWGETPCLTLQRMLEQVQAKPEDVFYDLGCGRGLTTLYANMATGMRSIGLEVLPGFVRKAQATATALHLSNVTFRVADLRTQDISGGSIYLIAWTTFPEALLDSLTRRFEALPAGTRVITLTHPIRSAWYAQKGTETLPFSWGSGTVYYQERKP